MKRLYLALTVAAGLAFATEAWAECANYISSGINDDPVSGWLLGSETRTEEISAQPGGVGGSMSREYEVGHYQLSDGSIQAYDCRTYRPTFN